MVPVSLAIGASGNCSSCETLKTRGFTGDSSGTHWPKNTPWDDEQDAHGRNRTTFGDDLCCPFVVILGMVYIGFTT